MVWTEAALAVRPHRQTSNRLPLIRLLKTLLLISLAIPIAALPAAGQVAPRESVSSDDISVAEGLQLPTYGHVWALDTWKAVSELVRLRSPNAGADDTGFSLKGRHSTGFKGEIAMVRLHDAQPVFFLRGVSGDDGRSDMVIVHLVPDGRDRTVAKEVLTQIKQRAKHPDAQINDAISLQQKRVGATDWYRLVPQQTLAPGEYALVPLPGSPGFADDEIFDFAVDPQAPENDQPLRSEQNRGAQ